ncbi:MAG: helical backbone metal receptor [Polyangiaceae bacterium]
MQDARAESDLAADRHSRRRARGLLALGWWLTVVALLAACDRERETAPEAEGPRFVSLAPAITETLFAIGAGDQVVAVSQYCERPKQAQRLPKVGTAMTPNYEAIARLRPTLIFTESNKSAKQQELRELGPTLELPWLTLGEITASVRRLGERTGHAERAASIAQRMTKELGKTPPPGAPRVLLVLGYGAKSSIDEAWFIRRNSLHGAALASAGGRNAVDHDVTGLPRLTVQQVLELDPEMVIVLVQAKRQEEAAILAAWNQLSPLRAVKQHRVAVLEAPEAFGNGPSILELREKLERQIHALEKPAPASTASAEPSASPSGAPGNAP